MKSKTSIYHLFRPRSEAHAVETSRLGHADGADGICFELASLPLAERTVEVFRRIVAATPLPKIFCTYRNDLFLGADDEARMACLLRAAEAGADFIDVMGDLYDPSPVQLTHAPAAVERQRKVIERIHVLGAKAVVSSHVTDRTLSADEIVAHLQAQADRGADVCKLVTCLPSASDYVEGAKALARLQDSFPRPWVLLGNGAYGRTLRFAGPSFGCWVEFAVHDYDPLETYDQPTIRTFREILDALSWSRP